MKLLKIAVEKQRWDLAAHTIVLATASILKNGDKPRISRKVKGSNLMKISSNSAVEIDKKQVKRV